MCSVKGSNAMDMLSLGINTCFNRLKFTMILYVYHSNADHVRSAGFMYMYSTSI